jgi:hypothetical protein
MRTSPKPKLVNYKRMAHDYRGALVALAQNYFPHITARELLVRLDKKYGVKTPAL